MLARTLERDGASFPRFDVGRWTHSNVEAVNKMNEACEVRGKELRDW